MRLIRRLLWALDPTCPCLWRRIGRDTSIRRSARIRNSERIELGDGVEIEDNAVLDCSSRASLSIGDHSHIHTHAILMTYGGQISLGSYCTVNPFCILYGHGGIKIGNEVRIATHTVMVASNHVYDDPNRSIRSQGVTGRGIVVEDDVWVGAGVSVLDGVTIGRGSVVGAGAVVTTDVPPYSVVGGVPARILKWRKSPEAVKHHHD